MLERDDRVLDVDVERNALERRARVTTVGAPVTNVPFTMYGLPNTTFDTTGSGLIAPPSPTTSAS